MHYYPHHIGDFTRDTARLSDAQCMAYLRMIWAYYDTEKPLPDNPESLAFQLGTTPELVRQILQHYFVLTDGVWVHARCEAVITEYHAKSVKAQNSANARWKNAKAMRTHTERNADAPKNDANQEPITNNQEKTEEREAPRKRVTCPPDVDQQTWTDWQALRKAKRAPVTETVINGARREADKAGMSLTDFLQVWCRRGSQGLEAAWLKPEERAMSFAEQDRQARADEMAKWAPGIATNRKDIFDADDQSYRQIV